MPVAEIALLDDNHDFIDILSGVLKTNCDYFMDPDLCLRSAQGGNYKLIITDKNMPKQNGIAFLRSIRKISSTVHLILLTGYTYEITPGQEKELESLDVKIYSKSGNDDWAELFSCISSYTGTQFDDESGRASLDCVESLIDSADADRTLSFRNSLITVIADQIIRDLKMLPHGSVIASSKGEYTVEDLIRDIKSESISGLEFINYWVNAKDRLSDLLEHRNTMESAGARTSNYDVAKSYVDRTMKDSS